MASATSRGLVSGASWCIEYRAAGQPVGWSWFDDEAGVRVTPAAPGKMIAARVTYLEGWAVRAILARHDAAHRLVPGADRDVAVMTRPACRVP
jgi:hypothetical protein